MDIHSLKVGDGFNFVEKKGRQVTDIYYGSSGSVRKKVDISNFYFGKVLKKNLKTTVIVVPDGYGCTFPEGLAGTKNYVTIYKILTIHVNEIIEVQLNDFVTDHDLKPGY